MTAPDFRDAGADHRDRAASETALAAIEAAHASEIRALRTQLHSAEQGRVAAEGRADALRDKVDQQAQVIAGIERDLRAAEVAAVQARAEALQTAEALHRADKARKAEGRLRRIWAAWRRG